MTIKDTSGLEAALNDKYQASNVVKSTKNEFSRDSRVYLKLRHLYSNAQSASNAWYDVQSLKINGSSEVNISDKDYSQSNAKKNALILFNQWEQALADKTKEKENEINNNATEANVRKASSPILGLDLAEGITTIINDIWDQQHKTKEESIEKINSVINNAKWSDFEKLIESQ